MILTLILIILASLRRRAHLEEDEHHVVEALHVLQPGPVLQQDRVHDLGHAVYVYGRAGARTATYITCCAA